MKEKIRFGNLSDGSLFEWAGKSFKKISHRSAATGNSTFIFETKDLVTIERSDDVVDDWGDLVVPGIGYISTGTSPDDLMDSYVYNESLQDKCN